MKIELKTKSLREINRMVESNGLDPKTVKIDSIILERFDTPDEPFVRLTLKGKKLK
jgi:hypothetical protein